MPRKPFDLAVTDFAHSIGVLVRRARAASASQDLSWTETAVLKRLAHATGGEAFLPESLTDVTPICERIARDIRNQYTIAYVPTNKKRDGTYRVIQVKAIAPGGRRLSVRTRPGYFAPSALPSKAVVVKDREIKN